MLLNRTSLCAVVVTWLLSKQNQIPSRGIGGSLDLSRADRLSVYHKSTLAAKAFAASLMQTSAALPRRSYWYSNNNCYAMGMIVHSRAGVLSNEDLI